jgi:arsenical pump membrane protein
MWTACGHGKIASKTGPLLSRVHAGAPIVGYVPSINHAAVWAVSGAAIAGILTRPRRVPEWCSALAGAAILLIAGLVPAGVAVHALRDGLGVFLFLAGMIALSELARIAGVFDWLAALAIPAARGSAHGLFGWVYALGVGVTALLSNDATILLLTPAVLAAVRRAAAPPLPFLFACAFVANAASFLLPISNPANLVVFDTLPRFWTWLSAFGLPSLVAVASTYAVLWFLYRRSLQGPLDQPASSVTLDKTGKRAAAAVTISVLLLIAGAGLGWPVGLMASALGASALALVAIFEGRIAQRVVAESPWSIILLVAGLFIIVAALDAGGMLNVAREFFMYASSLPQPISKLFVGTAVTIADNVFNNLPVGLVVRSALHAGSVSAPLSHAALIGVDLGPNVAVTGSLATLLWLIILRRNGIEIAPARFLQVGLLVTIPALLLALAVVR